MTAEIAILNRTAVALAADSIVTLAGEGHRRKTYDSAEKIFELSKFQPIGLMIYNNAQFTNAPLEILIRRFREKLTSRQFERLVQIWPEFESYLLKFREDSVDDLEHFRAFAVLELEPLSDVLFEHMIQRVGRPRTRAKESPEQLLLRRMRERKAEAEASPLETLPAAASLAAFSETYGPMLEGIAGKSLSPIVIEGEVRTALHEMMFAVLCSTTQSEAFTGLVFAGFGEKDLFPTLYALEVDGVYFGAFRVLTKRLVDIDRKTETAAVVPFAQKDMPERFILGIDKEFEGAIEKLAQNVVGEVVDQKKRAFAGGLGEAVKAAAAKQFRDGIDRIKKNNETNLNRVVNHLSKKELGEVAYHLVELTSRKRRYSSELETVGGPIDVAILTRNEGFIWVRRKHYFDVDINPRYHAGP